MTVSLVKLDRASNGTYVWSWGERERVRMVTYDADSGRVYIEWPESIRTVVVPGHAPFTGQRMPGWADVARVMGDASADYDN